MPVAGREFLLLFVPLTVLLYYLLFKTPRQKMIFLLAASYLFYAIAGWQFVPLLLGLSLVTYFAALKGWFKAGIVLNLLALGLFKYWNFGVQNLDVLTSYFGLHLAGGILKFGLPLGISFFVFKHIGYLLDVELRRYPASTDLLAFGTFSAYFPQISAGPISTYKDTAGQFSQLPAKLAGNQAYEALVYISLGLAKKILVADTLGTLLASSINKVGGFNGLIPAWYLVIAYAAQLYFDFSGYTDMVIGISKLFGVNLPQNFNNPYLAANPGEFWERWHMSLSQWFRYYLFSPLSRSLLRRWGSEKRDWAQYAANLVTMTLVGLWHGASWSYILWGTYHGVLLDLNAWWKRKSTNVTSWIGKPIFLLSILLGWALFMSPNASYLKHLLTQMVGLGGLGKPYLLQKLLVNPATLALLVAIPVAFSGFTEAANFLARSDVAQKRWTAIGLGILAVVCVFLMQTGIQFLYVQF